MRKRMKLCLATLSCRSAAVLLFIGCSVPSVFAANVNFSIEPKIGFTYGQSREIVYPIGLTTVNPYLSELKWDINSAFMLGLAVRMNIKQKWELYVDIQGAMPLPSGIMVDTDWLYLNLRDAWSHRSISDIRIQNGFILDTGFDWLLGKSPFKILIGIGYNLDLWQWSDSLKSLVYTTDAEGGFFPNPTKEFEEGDPLQNSKVEADGRNNINYLVAYHVPYAAVGFFYTKGILFARSRISIGPVIASGHDHHLERGLHFYDVGVGGPWLSFDSQFGIHFSDSFNVYLDGRVAWLPETRGSSQAENEDQTFNEVSIGGAGFAFWRMNLQLVFAFTF